jgi:hypothetical protein
MGTAVPYKNRVSDMEQIVQEMQKCDFRSALL